MRCMWLVWSARTVSAAFLILLVAICSSGMATAQVAVDTSELPPESDPPDCEQLLTHYVGIDQHAFFPSGIDFSNPRHYCFENLVIQPGPAPGDELETFDTIVEGTWDDGSGPAVVVLQGPVSINVEGKNGATTGSWQTEILSMDLAGDVHGIPIQIRESPSLPSLGMTSVAADGSGRFVIDSFFDVFLELSVAGGPFEAHLAGPLRMELMRIVRRSAILPTPDLPPEPNPLNCDRIVSHYVGKDGLALFPGGIEFGNSIHKCFENAMTSTDSGTGDETQNFDSTVEGTFDDGTGPQPVVLTGPVTTIVRGKGGATTGSWDTEILSMSLSGKVGGVDIDIRESPTKTSDGKKKVKQRMGGDYQIDSFFDVFTELSIGGGPFQPQTNPAARLELERIPPKVVLKSPDFPPESDPPNCARIQSLYAGRDVHALFPSGIDFSDLIHKCFKNAQVTLDPGTGDETATVDSTLEVMFDDGSGPEVVVLTGPVTTVVRGKGGATTGSWDTEILSMSLSGDVGGVSIDIRESPKLRSPGKKKVKKKAKAGGPDRFVVDSFFDVFTEISINGGAFQPQTDDAGRMELEPIRPNVRLRHSELPPERDPPNCERIVSHYVGGDFHALFPGGVDFSDPIHKCFKNAQVTVDPGTGDETETVDSVLEGLYDDGSGPQAVILTGPVTTVVRGKGGATTGRWDTEILSMDLTGDVGGVSIDIRESPSKKSPGKTKVKKKAKANGPDRFVIDSFFDVFVELSIDGGAFQPQTNGAGRMDLEPIRPSVRRPDADLPPEQDPPDCDDVATRYEGLGLQAQFPNGIDLTRVRHKCFENVATSTDPGTGDETESFDSTVTGLFDDGSGPQKVTLTGPVSKIVRGKGGATTGSWDTEILSMSLSGNVGGVGIEIRESPSKKSPGEAKIADNGDGTFQVDSFFDVFTELSIDGGAFQPQTTEAGRMDLMRARPSAVLPQPDLPPEPNAPDCDRIASRYASADAVPTTFPGGIELSEPIHKCFQNVSVVTDPGTGDETATSDTILEGMYDDGSGPEAVTLTGPVTTVVRGKGGGTTGTWDTEILSMSLSGSVGGIPIEIRESPVKSSEGKTKVDDIGGGRFEIDSFFDVFTELSVNGGPFEPQTNEAVRIELPEPNDWLVMLAALPVLCWMARRRARTVGQEAGRRA